jgi:hypothetical protein
MAFEELDELLNSFAEADRPAMRDALTRNPNAATLLTSQHTVYKAFVDGDPVRLASAASSVTPPPAVVPPPAATQPLGIDLAALDARLAGFQRSMFESPEFGTAVEARAKQIADAAIAAVTPNLIGRGAKIADTIATIRESHRAEFGEPLDSAKFEEFYAKEGPVYGNDLVRSHAAFVSEKRIEARVKKGVDEGLAAAATNNVPGTSLPASDSPLAGFIDYNVKQSGGKAPTADANDAAKAFQAMRGNWTM